MSYIFILETPLASVGWVEPATPNDFELVCRVS